MRNIVATDRYRALLVDPTGGHFHPLRLAQGEAMAFEALGGRIFEHSAVTRIERGDPAFVHTTEGQVRARFAIVACNAYIGELEPALLGRSMPCGTQVVATEPLGALARELLPQDHCVEDCNFMLDYFRLSAEGRLLYGGGVIYGARDPAHIESIIRPKMLKTFPQTPRPAPRFELAFDLWVALEPEVEHGRTPLGLRSRAPIIGGHFSGPRIAGEMLAGGSDWQLLRADGWLGTTAGWPCGSGLWFRRSAEPHERFADPVVPIRRVRPAPRAPSPSCGLRSLQAARARSAPPDVGPGTARRSR